MAAAAPDFREKAAKSRHRADCLPGDRIELNAQSGAALMAVETLGEAYALGWRVLARCAGYGRIDGRTSRSNRECTYRHELDVESLCLDSAAEISR